MARENRPHAPKRANPQDGPMQDRRTYGVATPERVDAGDPAGDGDTPDQLGIEIDNAIERPQEGQPGRANE